MSARAGILGRLRNSAGSGAAVPGQNVTATAVSAWRLPTDRDGLVAMFADRAAKTAAVVQRVGSAQALEHALRELRATMPLATADRQLTTEFSLLVASSADFDSPCHIVRANAGIAETGTVILAGTRATTRQIFLCEHLVVLLRASDILPCQEDYWQQQASTLPQALHLVSGPSRTADVEQTLQIGAHGPRAVTIFLTDGNLHDLPGS